MRTTGYIFLALAIAYVNLPAKLQAAPSPEMETKLKNHDAEIQQLKTKVIDLESKYDELIHMVTETMPTNAQEHTVPASSTVPVFENEFLAVHPSAIARLDEQDAVRIVLYFKNTTPQNIYLTFFNHAGDEYLAFLLDNEGALWSLSSGIVGIGTYTGHYNSLGTSAMTLLSPGQSVPVIFTFQPTQPTNGDTFSFNAKLIGAVERDYPKFTISFGDIRLPK